MSKIIADQCFCCGQSKTRYQVRSWLGRLDDLLTAAHEGCLRCDLAAKCFRCFGSDNFMPEYEFSINVNLKQNSLILLRDGTKNYFKVDIFSLDQRRISAPFNDIPTMRLLPGKTSSDTTFETIAGWIKDCDLNHTSCSSLNSTSQTHFKPPKRLLEVTGEQIVLREHLSNQPVYACLSHCWGDSGTITKTTMKNLDIFKIAVPWNDLAKTFQDAVDICRRLDIHFLWIDSLCIIQDCKADWEDQSPQMASIYENAFLKIAATASEGNSGGCYRTTDPVYLAKRVPGTGVYVRQSPPGFEADRSPHNQKEQPLFSRAWIYQELKLSRRVLHFCAHEVVWVCREVRKSESGRNDVTLSSNAHPYRYGVSTAVWYEKLPIRYLRMLWYQTINEYSTLQLTFSKDRLPALAALTQKMEKLRGGHDRFLAGLWEKTLLSDLLWWVKLLPGTGRSNVPQAPTWSWVSVPSAVSWDIIGSSILSSVSFINAHCIAKGPACMGVILEASVTLRVPSFRAWTGDEGSITLDSKQFYIHYFGKDYDFSCPGQSHIPPDTEILIIVISIQKSTGIFQGLALWKKKDSSCYERIGYAIIKSEGSHLGLSVMETEAVMDRSESCLLNMTHSDITIV